MPVLAAAFQPPEETAGEIQQPGTVGLSPGTATESPFGKNIYTWSSPAQTTE